MFELILGGVRSGKSRLAQEHAMQLGGTVTYLATATTNGDEEMEKRISQHRASRPAEWLLVEEPLALAETLKTHCKSGQVVLVECLTLWLSNLLMQPDPDLLAKQVRALLDNLADLPGHIIFVGNETGSGIIPDNALARRFCDEAGKLHQSLAKSCQRVTLTVAGLPLIIKDLKE